MIFFSRWRMVVYGGIDGFSQLIVYLNCATDNTAATVISEFHKVVRKYGLPSHIQSDKGGENTQVAMYMLEHPLRGPSRGSMIVGRSIHNQRINACGEMMSFKVPSSSFMACFTT